MKAEVIVVGSGPGAVVAAQALIEAGRAVLMLDYGNEDRHYAPLIPEKPFEEIRRTDPDQHRYFLGDNFEGVPFGEVRVGAQLTPPRMHISADTDRLTPVASEEFGPTESLALGGLGAGWGAGAFPFSEEEMRGWPISLSDLAPHYEAVAERIGISGAEDDLAPFYGRMNALQPPLALDSIAESALARYESKRRAMNAAGFFMGRPWLAILSRELRGRGANPLYDMDFWADFRRSVWRPRWTLEELKASPRFAYLPRRLVLSFSEDESGAEVRARNADTGEEETHRARSVVLGAGALGTARIVLRSLGEFGTRVPVVSNEYVYAPMVNLNMLGRAAKDARHSMSQLAAMYRPADGRPLVHGQLYSYRSLLTFKLMKEAPLPIPQNLQVMRALIPLFGILGIHHEDRPAPGKYLALRKGEGSAPDALEIGYAPSAAERAEQQKSEREFLRFFRRLRFLPIKLIRPGNGSSIHYAGPFPMSAAERPMTCGRDGRLAGTRGVYLADGSVLPHLPAKGLTFTIMANARRTALGLAARLGG